MNHSLVQGNGKASTEGSILAMSCMFNNSYSGRIFSFDSNSFIDNGGINSISIFDFAVVLRRNLLIIQLLKI